MDHLARSRRWPAWHTVAAGLLFALMIAWSGHDNGATGDAKGMADGLARAKAAA